MIIDLVGATTTKIGLTVRCKLDPAHCPKGNVVSDEEMADTIVFAMRFMENETLRSGHETT